MNDYDDDDEYVIPRPRASIAKASVVGPTVYLANDDDEVSTLRSRGHLAVWNGWGQDGTDNESLRGADAVIIRDNDEFGYERAAASYRALEGTVKSVRVVQPVEGCLTFSDHVAAGYGVSDLVQVPAAVAEMGAGCLALDWDEVSAETTGVPDWLVPDVLERGRSHVVFAAAKTGKSLLMQDLTMALAAEGPILGSPNTLGQPVRVLYVDWENSRADVGERVAKMGYEPKNLTHLRYLSFPALPPLDTAEGGRKLLGLVDLHRAEVVVLDTTSRAVAGEENSADTVRALYRHTLVHLKARGITVVRLDHSGNDTARQRGSSAKADDVDTVWRLDKIAEDRLRLTCTHQRTGHHPDEINLSRGGAPLAHRRRDGDAVVPEVAELIAHLDRLGVPTTAGRLACRKALTGAKVKVSNTTLTEAVGVRKRAENLSRTGRPDSSSSKINNTCPQTSGHSTNSPAQTCPGQVADRSDNTPPVQDAGPVRRTAPPVRGQGAAGGSDPSRTEPSNSPDTDTDTEGTTR